jgi:hypothetical protein
MRVLPWEAGPCLNVMRVAILFLLLLCVPLFGQEPSAKPLQAPGGLTVIPPNISYESVTNRSDITELLPVLPETDPALGSEVPFKPELWAKDVRHSRDVWCLQFSFKPLRIIEVDIPNAAGSFDKKKIWYLVYNVAHSGPADLEEKRINSVLGSEVLAGNEKNLPVPGDKTSENLPRSAPLEVRRQTGTFEPSPGKDVPIRFVPQFVLATHRLVLGTLPVHPETEKMEWQTEAVSYNDRFIPLALPAIMKREGMRGVPKTTVTFPNEEIATGQDFWGVAMWTDVDPRIHEFSIYVSGLTNAYQWSDKKGEDGAYVNTGKIGEGRILKRRVLKIDWWRVGDAHSLNESQIHFGAKNNIMPASIFDLKGDLNRDGKIDADERKKYEEIFKEADTDGDGWISDAEKAEYHRIHQHWLQPSFGYEWLFL